MARRHGEHDGIERLPRPSSRRKVTRRSPAAIDGDDGGRKVDGVEFPSRCRGEMRERYGRETEAGGAGVVREMRSQSTNVASRRLDAIERRVEGGNEEWIPERARASAASCPVAASQLSNVAWPFLRSAAHR